MLTFFSKRIYKKDLETEVLNKIEELSQTYNSVFHYALAYLVRKQRNPKAFASCLSDYYVLTLKFPEVSPYIRNTALNEANALLKANLELKNYHLEITKEQLANANKKLKKLKKQQKNLIIINSNLKKGVFKLYKGCKYIKLNTDGTVAVYDKTYENIYLFEHQWLHPKLKQLRGAIGNIKDKIHRLEIKINKLSSKTYVPSIVLGSKKLLQQSMIKDGMSKGEIKIAKKKKEEYKAKRKKNFIVSGRNDTPYGNFYFRYNPETKTLNITDNKKTYCLNGVCFPYGQELIDNYYKEQPVDCSEWKTIKEKLKSLSENNSNEVAPVVKNNSRPITYTIEDKGEYYIIKCMYSERHNEYCNYYTKNGVIAIDKNSGFLSIVETNSSGQLIYSRDYHYQFRGKSSNQIQKQLEAVVNEIVLLAESKNKPIVCEQIKIKGSKKLSDYNDNKSKNFTRNMFAYNKIDTVLTSSCNKHNVGLIKVNPAYTSFIGKHKYQNIYDKSIHKMAALVIGRRGMGFNETIPPICKSMYSTFVDFNTNTFNQWKNLYKHLNKQS